MGASTVDLRQLAVRRDPPHQGGPAQSPRRPPRHWLTRYVLPGLLLLGFAGLVAWSASDYLFPSKPVTVVPLISSRAEVQNEGTPLFQAAGWVEPRPAPIVVSSYVEGMVDRMFVVEGQRVKAGEKVAVLNQTNAALAQQAAEVELELRAGEVTNAQALLQAARQKLEHPAHLRAALADAEATLAQKETELAALPFQVAAARARYEVAQRTLLSKQTVRAAIAEIQIDRAQGEVNTTHAQLKELQGRDELLRKGVLAQRQKRDALKHLLELKTDETRALAEAEGNLRNAQGRYKQAQLALTTAKLHLDRLTITAPVAGQVLAVVARPGVRLMGLAPGSLQDASTVITMYDPGQLQVRADVRLENVVQVQSGQKVKIETAAVRGAPLEGEVLGMTSQADLQKNTLQVKVSVASPPPTLRPDMLVQVTFLAPPTPRKSEGEAPLRLLIPRQLVESSAGGNRVWLADRGNGTARSRPVKLGQVSGDLVEIVEGLNLADRVIASGREGLNEGQRITISGEDLAQVQFPAAPSTSGKSGQKSGGRQ